MDNDLQIQRRVSHASPPPFSTSSQPILPSEFAIQFCSAIEKCYRFIAEHPEEWQFDKNIDFEVLNHVLRVHIQDGSIPQYHKLVRRLVDYQLEDGGWGNRRNDTISQLRSTAFCTQMLLRANRKLLDQKISTSVARSLRYILENQARDGSWTDSRWHRLDATSVAVGTLLFARNETFATAQHESALHRGMTFVISQRQSSGLWSYKPASSPVTITAHLLQKCATYRVSADLLEASATALMGLQNPTGDWDHGNVDHTCDATRCLVLCTSIVDDSSLRERVIDACQKSVIWLLAADSGTGYGDRPGRKAHVERTCDVLDTLLKFERFAADTKRLAGFWE